MCTQFYRRYSCGDKRKEDFRQCEKRRGTNVRCEPIESKFYEEAAHYCIEHMITDPSVGMKRVVGVRKEKS
ncbi:unnamed protein product [Aureobasidium uvarum]|uniref:Uncharacterized protein n=1 Tax=Aureobasidium uvarum TaxID=2773716 RepID=A0A9N8KCI9_9PEZI|nr:unnamed protein product [Aureobasidium uvarum]